MNDEIKTTPNPESAELYLIKLMRECEVSTKEELAKADEPFDNSENYIKLLQLADEELSSEIKSYLAQIYDRIYKEATEAMESASSENDFFQASCLLEDISSYKDAAELAQSCREKSEDIRHNSIYNKAVDRLRLAETWAPNDTTVQAYEASIAELKTIPHHKDAQERLAAYQARLFDIKVLIEKSRDMRQVRNKRKKRKNLIRLISIISSLLIAMVGAISAGYFFLTPKTYTHKMDIRIQEGDYEEQYSKLSEFRNLAPIDQILNKFVWIPTQKTSSGSDVFISLRLSYSYETSIDFLEGNIKSAEFTLGEATIDSQWHPLKLNSKIEIEFDENGNKIEETTIIGTITNSTEYKYNSQGQCTEETRSEDGKKTTLEHRYNNDGTRKKSVSRDAKGNETVHTYTYSENGLLLREKITSPDSRTSEIQYEYDENGNVVRSTAILPNGTENFTLYHDYKLYYVGK